MTRDEFWNPPDSGFNWVQTVFEFAVLPRMKPKSDQASMFYPFFALSPGDDSALNYTDSRSGDTIEITSQKDVGRATIEDRDLLLFVITHAAREANRNPADWMTSRRVRFRLGDYFEFTGNKTQPTRLPGGKIKPGKSPGGKQIKKVESALNRLTGTRIKTTITIDGKRQTAWESLLPYASITEPMLRQRGRGHAIWVEVQLCDWLYGAILAQTELLTIDPDYFQLRPLERRVYDIARKFCGHQSGWNIGHERLLELIGSRQAKKHIMAELREIAANQRLPEYTIQILPDTVAFKSKPKLAAKTAKNAPPPDHEYD